MREILFRGKRADTGEWIYGDLRQDEDLETAYIGGWDYFTADYALQREPFEYPVSPETVGQFTGMKDKNNRKLFEGDIIEYIFPVTNKAVEKETGVVIYDGCGFHIANDGCMLCVASGDGDVVIEVIGNINDNPDLLEVSDNG